MDSTRFGVRGAIGPSTQPAVPFLSPGQQNPLGGRMDDWKASTSGRYSEAGPLGVTLPASWSGSSVQSGAAGGRAASVGDGRNNLVPAASPDIDPALGAVLIRTLAAGN